MLVRGKHTILKTHHPRSQFYSAAVLSDTSGLGETLKKHLEALNVCFFVRARHRGPQSDIFGAAWLLKETCYCASNRDVEMCWQLISAGATSNHTFSRESLISHVGLSGDDGHAGGSHNSDSNLCF